MSMQERIEKGMALLDKAAPDWHWRVRPKTIDIQDMDDCVLGQCFGDYFDGLSKVGLGWQSEYQEYQHGFLDWTGFFPKWMWERGWMPSICGRKLSKAWERAIMKRREADQTYHDMENAINAVDSISHLGENLVKPELFEV